MSDSPAERPQAMIMFVVAWLVALYVYEIVQQTSNNTGVGIVAAVLVCAVNLYARKRAAATVETNFAFHFWLYLPVAVFFIVPVAIKLVVYLRSEDDVSWWSHLWSLLPFILKLGVPVACLLWVYFALGRWEPKTENEGK